MINKYFSGLNYTSANEDANVEMQICKEIKPKNILSICGSGSRVLPLLVSSPKLICSVDTSLTQLEVMKLRVATVTQLDFKTFSLFWGYAPFHPEENASKRKDIFYNKLKLLEETIYCLSKFFENARWQSLLYYGKWEKTFKLFSRWFRILTLNKNHHLFEFTDIENQTRYLRHEFPIFRFKLLIFILGHSYILNRLLYKGDYVKKNITDSYFNYYYKAFDRMFRQNLARYNFFLQYCLLGKIAYQEGNILEARESIFNQIKQVLDNKETQLLYSNNHILNEIKNGRKYDFVSFSDVPSYFQGEMEGNFLQEIRAGLNPGAWIVIRFYLRIPPVNTQGFIDVGQEFKELIENELVQVYKIKVYRFKG